MRAAMHGHFTVQEVDSGHQNCMTGTFTADPCRWSHTLFMFLVSVILNIVLLYPLWMDSSLGIEFYTDLKMDLQRYPDGFITSTERK